LYTFHAMKKLILESQIIRLDKFLACLFLLLILDKLSTTIVQSEKPLSVVLE